MSTHTEEKIREAFFRLHDNASGRSAKPYMSIPADPANDADLVLLAAIEELFELRAKVAPAVDATLDVTAELARVTAERDAALAGQLTNAATACRLARELEETTARADVQRLEGTLAEQARALELLTESCKVAKADHDARLAKAIEALKKVDEIACRSGPTIGYGEEPPEPLNPDGCELALLARDAIAALQGEQGPGDWAWVRRPELEAEQKASAALCAHLAAAANTLEALANPKRIDLADVRIFALERASFARSALADPNLGHDYVPRAELVGAEQQIAAWRILAERARECLASTSHHEECGRSDECEDADPGECGRHCNDGCPSCDCGASEWHETAAELHAALKETT